MIKPRTTLHDRKIAFGQRKNAEATAALIARGHAPRQTDWDAIAEAALKARKANG